MANIMLPLWVLLPVLRCVTGVPEHADFNFRSHLAVEFSNFEEWATNRTGDPIFHLNMPFSRHIVTNYTAYSYNRVDLHVKYSVMTIEGALRGIYDIYPVSDIHDNWFGVEWSSMVKLKGRYDVHGIFLDYYVERQGGFETLSYIFPWKFATYVVNNEGNMEKGETDGLCEVEPTGLTEFEDLYDDRPLGRKLAIFLSNQMATGEDIPLPTVDSLTEEFFEEFIFQKYSYEEITGPLVPIPSGQPSF